MHGQPHIRFTSLNMLVLRDYNRLRLFENMVHRKKTFGPKSDYVIGDLRNCTTGGFVNRASDQIF